MRNFRSASPPIQRHNLSPGLKPLNQYLTNLHSRHEVNKALSSPAPMTLHTRYLSLASSISGKLLADKRETIHRVKKNAKSVGLLVFGKLMKVPQPNSKFKTSEIMFKNILQPMSPTSHPVSHLGQ